MPRVQITLHAIAVCFALSACTTHVNTSASLVPPASAQAPGLARPNRVLIADFSLDQTVVRLDQGVAARLQRAGGDTAQAQQDKADAVQQAIADTLLTDIQTMGLPAQRLEPGMSPMPGDVEVTGQITRINEGNRTRRLVIGLGAGKSQVQATAQLYRARAGAEPQLLQTYDASSDSGHKPGLAIGGASSVAQSTVVPLALSAASSAHGEQTRTGVAGEGQRLAKGLAVNLGQFFAQQNWIPASAVPARALR